MKAISFLTLVAAMACLPDVADANQVRELPFEQQVKQADLVVIGRVESIKDDEGGGRYASVRVTKTLKGQSNQTIWVESRGLVAEMNPLCCSVGADYLFLLSAESDGRYRSVNGPHSVHEIAR